MVIGSLTWHVTLQDYDLLSLRLTPRAGGYSFTAHLRARETGEKQWVSFTLPAQPADRLLVTVGRRLQEALGG